MTATKLKDEWIQCKDFWGVQYWHNVNPHKPCPCHVCEKFRNPRNMIDHWDKCKCPQCQNKVKELEEKYYG